MDATATRRAPGGHAARLFLALALAPFGLAATTPAAAAEIQFPSPSPPARVSQWVGLTNVTVDYTTPAVAGRRIWGSVMPPGLVSVIGDRGAPTISFSRQVVLGGTAVPAGSYALLAVPSATAWTVILNREARLWRAADRNPALDVARVTAPVEPAPYRERLAFVFSDFTDRRAVLEVEWEKLRVRIPIDLETDAQIQNALRSLDDSWRRYADAAHYMLEKSDFDAGLNYANKSLALRETWYGSWVKASLLAARGDYAGAQEEAARAYRLGQAAGDAFTAEPQVKEALAAWSARTAQRPAEASPRRRPDARPQPERVAPPPIVTAKTEVVDPDLQPLPGASERPVEVPRAKAARPPTPAEFSPLIERGLPDLQRCYQRALRQDPSLSAAKVTLSIAVGVSGRVARVAVDPPLPARTLESCIEDAVGRWAFPPSPTEYETQVPLVLSGHS